MVINKIHVPMRQFTPPKKLLTGTWNSQRNNTWFPSAIFGVSKAPATHKINQKTFSLFSNFCFLKARKQKAKKKCFCFHFWLHFSLRDSLLLRISLFGDFSPELPWLPLPDPTPSLSNPPGFPWVSEVPPTGGSVISANGVPFAVEMGRLSSVPALGSIADRRALLPLLVIHFIHFLFFLLLFMLWLLILQISCSSFEFECEQNLVLNFKRQIKGSGFSWNWSLSALSLAKFNTLCVI